MVLVRTGGIFGLLIALLVAALFMFVVRPAINDTTDRAFQTADRAIDQANKQADQISKDVEQATQSDGNQLSGATFGATVAQIKGKLGSDAELLDMTVTPQSGNVKYRTGNRAAGFEWGLGHQGLDPVKVTLIGSGKLTDNVFPISKLSPDATTKLAAAVKAKAGAGFKTQAMTLGLNPVTGAVEWTVTGTGSGRQLVFQANADATGLTKVG
jgi:hypothetical protein